MGTEFIALLHYSREHAAWLHLTGWSSPPTLRDSMGALRQIESQTDEVVRERGEPERTPFVLVAGSIASDEAPHRVRKLWRLDPALADRLLTQIEDRSADEAIEEALAAWDEERADDDDAESLDLGDWVGIDFEDLAQRA